MRESPARFAWRCMTFAVVALIGFSVCQVALQSVVPESWSTVAWRLRASHDYVERRLAEVDSAEQVDVLALGSSLVYRSLDPAAFAEAGLTMINLGTSGQTQLEAGYVLRQALESCRPAVVLYEVTPTRFQTRSEQAILTLAVSAPLTPDLVATVLRARGWFAAQALAYRALAEPLGIYTPREAPRLPTEDVYESGGYVRYGGAGHYRAPPVAPRPERIVPLPVHATAFRENIALLRDAGVEVFLFRAPLPEATRATYLGDGAYHALMRSAGPVYDYAGTAGISDDEDFYDAWHLRHSGTRPFNAEIVADLLARYPSLGERSDSTTR